MDFRKTGTRTPQIDVPRELSASIAGGSVGFRTGLNTRPEGVSVLQDQVYEVADFCALEGGRGERACAEITPFNDRDGDQTTTEVFGPLKAALKTTHAPYEVRL